MNRDTDFRVYGKNAAAQFDPVRHLDPTGDIASGGSSIKERRAYFLLFGRTVWVDLRVSDNLIVINIAVLLWAPRSGVTEACLASFFPWTWVGLWVRVFRPVPYECEIMPRFSDALFLLSQEREPQGM